jgi:hypothetical protein
MFKKRTESGMREAQPATVTDKKPPVGAGGGARVATAPNPSTRQASAPVRGNKTSAGLTPEQIAARAYQLWEKRGKPQGTELDDWLQAERELREGR